MESRSSYMSTLQKLHSMYNFLLYTCIVTSVASQCPFPHDARPSTVNYHSRVQMRNPCQPQYFARWPPHILNWFQGICTKVGNVCKAFFIWATCEEVGEQFSSTPSCVQRGLSFICCRTSIFGCVRVSHNYLIIVPRVLLLSMSKCNIIFLRVRAPIIVGIFQHHKWFSAIGSDKELPHSINNCKT